LETPLGGKSIGIDDRFNGKGASPTFYKGYRNDEPKQDPLLFTNWKRGADGAGNYHNTPVEARNVSRVTQNTITYRDGFKESFFCPFHG